MTRRREFQKGSALLLVIATMLIVEAIVAVALLASLARARLVADERWSIEGELVAKSALALGRVHFATGAVLPEGPPQIESGLRPDGWRWSVTADRTGDLARLRAVVGRFLPDGLPIAGAKTTLLLRRLASDTLQRIPWHPRF